MTGWKRLERIFPCQVLRAFHFFHESSILYSSCKASLNRVEVSFPGPPNSSRAPCFRMFHGKATVERLLGSLRSSDSSPNPPKRPPFGHANARPSNHPSLGRDSGASESFAPESLWIMLTSLEVATCHTSIESSSTDQRKEREKARKLNVQYNNIYHTIAQENRIRLQPSLIHATNSKRLLCVDLPFEESLLACGSSDGCPFVRRARIAK